MGLNWVMRGLVRWGVFLAPIVVVITLGELHAHLVGHYQFTGTTRFAWTVGYVVLLEVGSYVAGVLSWPDSRPAAFGAGFLAAASAALVISLIQLVSGSLLLPREVVLGSALLLFPIYGLLGMAALHLRRQGLADDRVLAVLGPEEAAALEQDLGDGAERPAQLVKVLSPEEASPSDVGAGPAVDGEGKAPAKPLVASAAKHQPTVVVLGRAAQGDEAIVAQAASLHGGGLRVRTLSAFYDEWLGKLPLSDLERVSLMFDIQELHVPGYARLKRALDLVAGVVGLVVLVIATPVVWVVDRFGNAGPVFFRQPRVGKAGRVFTIIKFRTMGSDSLDGGWTADDDPRVPRVGRWLRRSHLDELPQAVNVLRGEVSLVGPRPEQQRYVEELEQKIPFYEVRHLVQPGVTGWAQVKFHYGASVEDALEKLQYEFFYMRHQGPVLDARILARTMRSVLRRQGR